MHTYNQHTAERRLVWISALVLIAFIVWANWAELDQITRANAQAIASSRNQIVQSPEGGILSELLVSDGESVKKGQILARFDKTKAKEHYAESTSKAAGLMATIARLKAEVYGGLPRFPDRVLKYPEFHKNQLTLFKRRNKGLEDEISVLESSLGLIQEELEMNMPLLRTGDVSKTEILKLQRQIIDTKGEIVKKRNMFFQEALKELVKAEEDLDGVLHVMAQREEQLSFTEIHSPMDGFIRNIKLTTIGGVAKSGDEIMQIVPAGDDLILEAKVKPSDIAFIKPGLPAIVKLDAYDYSIYGSLDGEVIYISADTLDEEKSNSDESYYRVQIKTKTNNLINKNNDEIYIQPGMTAVIEIITGRKTVLDYLTKPITKTFRESMGER